MTPHADNEDAPVKVPKSYHPQCHRCGEQHSPFEPCDHRAIDSESSAAMLAVGLLCAIPLVVIGAVFLVHWL